MISVSLYWPLALEPTLIFLVTGFLVTVASLRTSSPATPFLISLVTGVCFSPSSPFWSSTITFGARLGSTVTSVSNGIGSLSTYSRVPSKSLLPTSIIAATGSFLSTCVSTTLEFSIVQVVLISPSWPFCSTSSTFLYLHSPFASSLFSSTFTSNGIFSMCSILLFVPEAKNWAFATSVPTSCPFST